MKSVFIYLMANKSIAYLKGASINYSTVNDKKTYTPDNSWATDTYQVVVGYAVLPKFSLGLDFNKQLEVLVPNPRNIEMQNRLLIKR
jgi:hypothetical protein